MQRSLRFAALMICAGLTGCMLAPVMQTSVTTLPDKDCTAAGDCLVDVSIETKGKDCSVLCNPVAPHKVHVTGATLNKFRKIVWQVPKESNFRFARWDGIAFKDDKAPFNCKRDSEGNGPSDDRMQWTCTDNGKLDRNKQDETWDYTVWLFSDQSFSWPLDPSVVNH